METVEDELFSALKPNLSELLLSQSVIKLPLHSVLLFFSIDGDL